MTSLVLANNAQSVLTSAISASATQITVASGQGALFPSPGANEWFPLTLIPADGSAHEIVRATGRSSDVITIVRAREGTTALTLAAGDLVLHQMTAAAYLDLASSGNVSELSESSGTSSAYVVASDDITSLENGQSLSFMPHVDSVNAITLKIGALTAVPVLKKLNDGDGFVPLTSGDVLSGVQTIVSYNASESAFILANPSNTSVPEADETTSGTVTRATASTVSYDLAGNDEEYVTERSASEIAQDAFEFLNSLEADNNLPYIWRSLGNESQGDVVAENSTVITRQCQLIHDMSSLTVDNGGTLDITGFGVCVIRSTGTVRLNGTLNFPGGSIAYPLPVVGPTGAYHTAHPSTSTAVKVNSIPSVHPGLAPPISTNILGNGIKATTGLVRAAIQSGLPHSSFQGGNGSTYNEQVASTARGGLIIIAPRVELGPDLVVNNMNPTLMQNFGGGALQNGSGAGGMMILVTEDDSIDSGALYEAHEDGVPLDRIAMDAAGLITPATPGDPVAANGQLFVVHRELGTVARIF